MLYYFVIFDNIFCYILLYFFTFLLFWLQALESMSRRSNPRSRHSPGIQIQAPGTQIQLQALNCTIVFVRLKQYMIFNLFHQINTGALPGNQNHTKPLFYCCIFFLWFSSFFLFLFDFLSFLFFVFFFRVYLFFVFIFYVISLFLLFSICFYYYFCFYSFRFWFVIICFSLPFLFFLSVPLFFFVFFE